MAFNRFHENQVSSFSVILLENGNKTTIKATHCLFFADGSYTLIHGSVLAKLQRFHFVVYCWPYLTIINQMDGFQYWTVISVSMVWF